MSSTFAARLAASDGRDLRKYIAVEGVDGVFQEDSVDVPAALVAGGRSSLRMKTVRVVTSERKELDRINRRQTGGGCRIVLVDDASFTLRSLFAARRRRSTFITADATAADTTIHVSDSSAFPDTGGGAGVCYVGSETIPFTGRTATTLTGCTRGGFGSTAARRLGGSLNGEAVYKSPPSWAGRKLTLTGYFLGFTGSAPTSTDMQSTLGTFEIADAPKYVGDNQWEIKAVDRIDGYMKRAIYMGVKRFTQTQLRVGQYEASLTFNAPEILGALFGLNDPVAAAGAAPFATDVLFIIESDADKAVWTVQKATEVTSISLNADNTVREAVIKVIDPGITAPVATFAGGNFALYSSILPIAYWSSNADDVAMKFLKSRLGDGANGADDVFPGLARTALDGNESRLGAGILAADVDDAAFTAVGGRDTWSFLADRPSTAGDLLREFCFLTDSFAYTTVDGTLSVKSMSDSFHDDATITIDNGDLVVGGNVEVTYDEANIYPSVVLKTNYDRTDDSFKVITEVNDAELSERYPTRNATLTIEMKSIRILPGTSTTAITGPGFHLEYFEGRLRRYQVDEAGRGALFVDVPTDLTASMLTLGDFVTLDVSDAPDFEGSTISEKRGRVVSIEPVWDEGRAMVRVQVLRGSKLVAPAATITGHAGAVMTLDTTSFFGPADGKPGRMFGANVKVLVWDVSGNISEQHSIVSVTDGSVTLDSAPGFTPQDTVDFITFDTADQADTNVTDNGFVPETDFIFMVEDDETTFNAGSGESRWR